MEKVPTKKMRALVVPHTPILLAGPGQGFWRGWRNWDVEVLGGPGSLAICGKGGQPRIFLDKGPSASESFQYSSSNSVLVLWFHEGEGEAWDFGSRHGWRSKFSPLHTLQLRDLWFWAVVSEKQLSISFHGTGSCETVLWFHRAAPSSSGPSFPRAQRQMTSQNSLLQPQLSDGLITSLLTEQDG